MIDPWVLVPVAVALAIVLSSRLAALRAIPRATRAADGTQRATIVVRGSYRPNRYQLVSGVPAVLRFDRREDEPCSEMLVCELLPSEYRLAPFAVTEVRFTPAAPGSYAFTCAFGMYSGRLVVRAADRVP